MAPRKLLFRSIFLVCFLDASTAVARSPIKYRDPLLRIPVSESRFPGRWIADSTFVVAKSREWNACHRPARVFEATARNDSIPDFLEAPVQAATLEKMESLGLMKGQVRVAPWSGDYWPYANGLIAARFMDSEFAALPDWASRFDFVRRHPAASLLREGPSGIRRLSASEKYDLLIGEPRFQFTDAMWAEGKRYFDATGDVESWMGLCHGWAPAAIMEPRPRHTINVRTAAPEGLDLSFNPSEMKGLVSYSWATNEYDTAFLGSRCQKKNPRRDANGRLLDSECFDLNPATWHLVVVNSVGLLKRSFILDATFDYEVWNQPILGYSYSYFHPSAGVAVRTMEDATIDRHAFPNDPFAKYRDPRTQWIVGVEMAVGYVVETPANERDQDLPANDSIRWVKYRYDLELDARRNIVGGEWHEEAHPDFVWTPRQKARPQSSMDPLVTPASWSDLGPIPPLWREASRRQAIDGRILHAIAKALVGKSAQ